MKYSLCCLSMAEFLSMQQIELLMHRNHIHLILKGIIEMMTEETTQETTKNDGKTVNKHTNWH